MTCRCPPISRALFPGGKRWSLFLYSFSSDVICFLQFVELVVRMVLLCACDGSFLGYLVMMALFFVSFCVSSMSKGWRPVVRSSRGNWSVYFQSYSRIGLETSTKLECLFDPILGDSSCRVSAARWCRWGRHNRTWMELSIVSVRPPPA